MKIAVDVSSGERPCEELIAGVVDAVNGSDVEAIVVGDESKTLELLGTFSYKKEAITLAHASEVIGMDESPASACRRKQDSSIMVASRLVGEGKADGLFSPGNTGATLAASLMNIKRVTGVKRPSLATVLPNKVGKTLLLDIGANIDCKPIHLMQFAIMGMVFMSELEGIKPRIGLLNVGEEEKKGNELALKSHEMLKGLGSSFIGNVEGYDVFDGRVDVIVCDGFIGNILLKVFEGFGTTMTSFMKDEMRGNLIDTVGGFLSTRLLKKVRSRFNPANYGGAPLLGLNGCVIVGHGKSDRLATKNAVLLADRMLRTSLTDAIKTSIEKY